MLDDRPGQGRAEGPAAARADVPRRHVAGPHHRRRRDQGRRSRPQHPYGEWLHAGLVHLDDLPTASLAHAAAHGSRASSSSACSATRPRSSRSCSRRWPGPVTSRIGSMGTDTPIAVLSRPAAAAVRLLQQLFAQVTNPPLDAIREELVTSLASHDRSRGEPARPGPGVVPPDRAAVPDPVERRPGQAAVHQRGRRRRRASSRSPSTACTPSPRAARACARALDDVRDA